MKGRILGCDGGGCVINGEDGSRYTFALAEWKGSRPPQARDEVDFVGSGTTASDVFPVNAAPALAVQGLDGDAGRKVMAVLRDRPQVILAVIVLLASVLFTFVQVKGLGDTPQWRSTAFGLPGKVGAIRAVARDGIKAETAYSQVGTVGGMFGQSTPSTPPSLPAAAQAKLDQVNGVLALSQLVVLIYLVPAGAVALLVFEYRQRRNRMVELATGVVALLSVAATFYAREAAAQYVTQQVGAGADTFKQAFQLGLGGWLFVACGAGLVATGLGYLRRTPGLPG